MPGSGVAGCKGGDVVVGASDALDISVGTGVAGVFGLFFGSGFTGRIVSSAYANVGLSADSLVVCLARKRLLFIGIHSSISLKRKITFENDHKENVQ